MCASFLVGFFWAFKLDKACITYPILNSQGCCRQLELLCHPTGHHTQFPTHQQCKPLLSLHRIEQKNSVHLSFSQVVWFHSCRHLVTEQIHPIKQNKSTNTSCIITSIADIFTNSTKLHITCSFPSVLL